MLHLIFPALVRHHRDVHHRGVRDRVHGGRRHGVHRLSRSGHWRTGHDHCRDLGAAVAASRGRLERRADARCRPAISRLLGDGGFSNALGFLLPTMLLLVGNQGMYQKFFSARSEKDAKICSRRMDRRHGVSRNDADHAGGDREFEVSRPTARAKLFRLRHAKDCRRCSVRFCWAGFSRRSSPPPTITCSLRRRI